MYNKKRIETKYIVLIILLIIAVFLGIMSITINDNRKLNPIEKTVKDSLLFVNKIVYAPIDFINDKIKAYKDKKDLYNKYKELQKKMDKVDLIEAEKSELQKQLDNLKEVLDLNNLLTDNSYLNATVVNRNVGYWYNTITIDKGSNNGVNEDMAVITNKGLLGRIIKTSNFNSNVKLLTSDDSNNKISIKIEVNGEYLYGLLSGYDDNDKSFIIEGVAENKEIPIDSIVTTTGMGGIFPSGILIGKVKTISMDNFGLSKIVKVRSEVDFDDISYVTILKKEVVEQ